jgi:hypothetical protein
MIVCFIICGSMTASHVFPGCNEATRLYTGSLRVFIIKPDPFMIWINFYVYKTHEPLRVDLKLERYLREQNFRMFRSPGRLCSSKKFRKEDDKSNFKSSTIEKTYLKGHIFGCYLIKRAILTLWPIRISSSFKMGLARNWVVYFFSVCVLHNFLYLHKNCSGLFLRLPSLSANLPSLDR